MSDVPTYTQDREAHLRDIGDDPAWTRLVQEAAFLRRLLDDWEQTIASHPNMRAEDLRSWLDAVHARLVTRRGARDAA